MVVVVVVLVVVLVVLVVVLVVLVVVVVVVVVAVVVVGCGGCCQHFTDGAMLPTALTMSHELGHNVAMLHDDDRECFLKKKVDNTYSHPPPHIPSSFARSECLCISITKK